MAAVTSATVALAVASDVLKGSANGVPLGRARFSSTSRNFSIVAKVKKHDYPWTDDPDPNAKGAPLIHLSSFKPLKEKGRPVHLDFEKPLLDLEKKIIDVRKMADKTGLDFSDQILSLENKYQQALKDLYANLTPIQRVHIARHPNRPTFLDHVFAITDKFVELHGDRAGYDDPAIVTGIGSIDGRRCMFIGQQKGRNTKESIQRNFGMPTPHGYRKALRMMNYADHHGFPIVTFIDTPGAYADLESEHKGQGVAIAENLRAMFGLKVPILSIVIGEGGSGGALAIGCANKLLMLENAVFYVASPEACAAILWKTAKAAPKAAEKLKITAPELCKLEICDGIIPEPLGGAHADPSWTSLQIKNAIKEAMDELTAMDTETLLSHRALKFRKIGGWQEGLPIDPEKKRNMKKKDVPAGVKTPVAELEGEVERLKEQISKAKVSPSRPADFALEAMIKKLKREIDLEFAEAVNALGLQDRFSMLREEFVKTSSNDELMHPSLKDKIEKLKDEFHESLSAAPNFSTLKCKLDMLAELSKTKSIAERKSNGLALKQEINAKVKEVMDRPEMKAKMEALKAELGKPGASDADENILKMRKEIDLELANVLKSMGLDVQVVKSSPDFMVKAESLKDETFNKIENLVNSSEVRNMIELLKSEAAKAGKNPDATAQSKIEALKLEIKQKVTDDMESSELKEKYEDLKAEISSAIEPNGSVVPASFQDEV